MEDNKFKTKNGIDGVSFLPSGGQMTPLLFIHGSFTGHWIYRKIMDRLAGNGWPCHAFELRGHGDSLGSVNGARMSDYLDDVRSVIEHLELQKPVVIGHGLGGLLTMMYACRNDCSGVVSIDGSPTREGMTSSQTEYYPAEYTADSVDMPEEAVESLKAMPDLSQSQIEDIVSKLGKESGIARRERKEGISCKPSKIKAPILFLGAKQGSSLPFGISEEEIEYMSEVYKSTHIVIKGATHFGILLGVHWEETTDSIAKWLNDQDLK